MVKDTDTFQSTAQNKLSKQWKAYTNRGIKKGTIFLVAIFTLFAFTVTITNAAPYSYIYIQGDKTTPFYVKLNGTMVTRYSKNYCIIPKLEKGSYEIEILFQQNKYPSLAYHIVVPENGSKGFLLDKKEGNYLLYDFETKNYLTSEK